MSRNDPARLAAEAKELMEQYQNAANPTPVEEQPEVVEEEETLQAAPEPEDTAEELIADEAPEEPCWQELHQKQRGFRGWHGYHASSLSFGYVSRGQANKGCFMECVEDCRRQALEGAGRRRSARGGVQAKRQAPLSPPNTSKIKFHPQHQPNRRPDGGGPAIARRATPFVPRWVHTLTHARQSRAAPDPPTTEHSGPARSTPTPDWALFALRRLRRNIPLRISLPFCPFTIQLIAFYGFG